MEDDPTEQEPPVRPVRKISASSKQVAEAQVISDSYFQRRFENIVPNADNSTAATKRKRAERAKALEQEAQITGEQLPSPFLTSPTKPTDSK